MDQAEVTRALLRGETFVKDHVSVIPSSVTLSWDELERLRQRINSEEWHRNRVQVATEVVHAFSSMIMALQPEIGRLYREEFKTPAWTPERQAIIDRRNRIRAFCHWLGQFQRNDVYDWGLRPRES